MANKRESKSKSTKSRSGSEALSERIEAELEEQRRLVDDSSSAAYGSLKEWKEWGKKVGSIGAAVLLVVMLTGLVGIMSVGIFNEIDLRPQFPEFQVTALSSPHIQVSTDDRHSVNATWELKLLVASPNRKLGIRFKDLQVSLAYRSSSPPAHMLAAKQVPPPPYLNPGNQATLDLKLETLNSYVTPDLATKISGDSSGGAGGSVLLGIKVVSRWEFDTQRFGMGTILDSGGIEESCQWVQFQFHINNGSWTDGKTDFDSSTRCMC